MSENKVVLGNYLGVEVDGYEIVVSEEEIEQMVLQQQQQHSTSNKVTDRAVENGDTIVFDFAGFVDGVAFDGGTAKDYVLEVGSGSFIPGFEEQLVGAEMEKEINVNVVFPENYHSQQLAGKPALFVCKVHSIEEKGLPEVNDEFAKEVAGVDTVAELKEKVKEFIQYNKEEEAKKKQIEQAVNTIVENSQVELADEVLKREADLIKTQMQQQLMQQGLDMATYLSICGLTQEQMDEQFISLAKDRATKMVVLKEIAKKENIVVGPQDVEKQLSLLAQMYQIPAENLRTMIDMDEFKESLLTSFAAEIIANNMKTK